jgi:hypothetical protein
MLVLKPPPSSRGIAVVLACVEGDNILVLVVLVARVLGRVGVATNAHMNVPLPASCQLETIPNVLRNVLVRLVAGKLSVDKLADA